MRKRLALLGVVAGLAAPVAWVPVAAANPVAAIKTCRAGYVHAYLSWGQKCLRAGEFCKVGNREYRRFAFVSLSTGHLRRR